MFRFTQEPSSGSSPVLRWNYQYCLSVLVGIDVANVMAAYWPVVQACVRLNRPEDFLALKNPTASAEFEPANLGTRGQRAKP
jgi:hypothetical protein